MIGSAAAAVIQIDISPAAGSALSATNYASGDHTLGISAPNAVGQPASPGTGNEVGAGITFDNVSKTLSWDFGYGSDHGFTDLAGDFTVAHIHGPIAVQFPSPNTGAGIVVGLPHTAGSGARTGRFTGSSVLSATDEGRLLDNLLYINIHSAFAGGGEIRGQLVPVPEPSSGLLLLLSGCLLVWRRCQF